MKKIFLLTIVFLVAVFSYNQVFSINNLDKNACIKAGYKFKMTKAFNYRIGKKVYKSTCV